MQRVSILLSLSAASAFRLAPIQQMRAASTASSATEGILEQPLKRIIVPSNTVYEYDQVILKNGMKVTLCHVPDSEKSAAALTVAAGAQDDFADLQGIAHFTEHAVFLGSHKYPVENAFKDLLSKNGGSSNGGTGMEYTSYQFQVNQAEFSPALERWSRFFIDPLFTTEAISREVLAVDAEDSKNRILDARRMLQVLKDCITETSSYKKFSTGNLKTLANGDAVGNQEALTLRMKAFYEQHYNPVGMALALVGPQSIEELKNLSVSLFGAVAAKGAEGGALKPDSSKSDYSGVWPFKPSVVGSTLRVRPVKEARDLSLYIPMPPTRALHRAAPSRLLAYLLGHKGEGSLFSILQDRGWATATSAGERTDSADFTIFEISASLTEDGMRHYQEVVTEVWRHVRCINEASDETLLSYWRELQLLGSIDFAHQEKATAYELAPFLSRQMGLVPMHEILSDGWILGELDVGLLRSQFLSRLVPERAIAVLRSKEFASALPEDGAAAVAVHAAGETTTTIGTFHLEPWYETPYAVTAPVEAEMEAWRGALVGMQNDPESALIQSRHYLPAANPFVCSEVDLSQSACHTLAPKKLRSDPPVDISYPLNEGQALQRLRVFSGRDEAFAQPRFVVHCLVHSCGHAEFAGHPITSLIGQVFSQSEARFFYPSSVAGLSWGASVGSRGIGLTVSGFSPKLLALFERLATRFGSADYWRNVDEGVIAVVKDRMLRNLRSWTKERPDSIADTFLSVLLQEEAKLPAERLALAEGMNKAMLVETMERALSRARISVYVHGDQPRETALAAAETASRLVGTDMKEAELRAHQQEHGWGVEDRILRARCLPRGHTTLFFDSVNPDDPNSALLVHFQTATRSPATSALSIMLATLLREPAFNELRTKRQLGYIVNTAASGYGSRQGSMRGLTIRVLSQRYGPLEMQKAVDEFLLQQVAVFDALTAEDIALRADSVVKSLLDPPTTYEEEASQAWGNILEATPFTWIDEVIAEVKNLSVETVQRAFREWIAGNDEYGPGGRRSVSVMIESAAHKAQRASAGSEGSEGIDGHAATDLAGLLKLRDALPFVHV